MDGAGIVPQAAAVLSAYEAHFSQEYGQQRVQGINLAKVSSERKGNENRRVNVDFFLPVLAG